MHCYACTVLQQVGKPKKDSLDNEASTLLGAPPKVNQ